MMNYLEEYDETDPISIETYAKRLIGKTFADVCRQDDITKAMVVRETANYEVKHENKKRKGGLGELIEERFFHYQTNNDARPDFDKAGVELKVTPYKQNKNGTLVAKERLILTMIDYFSVVDETFENSHMWQKARLILLVYYLYQQEIKNRLDYRIGYVKLFAPPEQDIKIIAHDFEVIVEKIRNGKAHELSEGDTLYLGAAPKAATSRDRRKQPFSAELAKPRAFAFKNSYMTYVLNNYIIPGKNTYEPIIKGTAEESFEDYDDASKVGDLVCLRNVTLSLMNEEDSYAVTKMILNGAFKDTKISSNSDDMQIELDLSAMINSLLKDCAYELECKTQETKFLITIPMTFENDFENSYNIYDLQAGSVTVVGINRGVRKHKRRKSCIRYNSIGNVP